MKQTFEDKLLVQLKQQITVEEPIRLRRPAWKGRVAVGGTLAVVAATVVALMLPAGTPGGVTSAYAVTESSDGNIVIDITDIRDADGLERAIEQHGLEASVHYLPQDKLCATPEIKDRMAGKRTPPMTDEELRLFHKGRGSVRVTEPTPGTIRFSIDRANVPDGYSLVILAEHDWAEHGQSDELVPSVAAMFEKGNRDGCELVDGSIEGWGFQLGLPPTTNKEDDFAKYKREHPEGSFGA